ncbi:PREDICTED: protein TAP1-like [Ipomoea nil]|uniref:protein TAP1-like n=1 Tax=Ipomoea nil TaxID=35883 RepID=UPI0009009E07|nr:PREDICTED: protein TAP1-like [Ipomoea nil]
MAGKMMKLIAAAVLAWVVVLAAAPSASANFAKLGCIAMCMRECRVVGLPAPACLKFCPKHCDPPLPSRPVFHCTLDCLNQCVSSQSTRNNNNDEEKQDTCITSCKNEKCGPTP